MVPTKDRPDQICRLLDSLSRLRSPEGGFEVVVVDDGSDRPYLDRMQAYAQLYALTVVRQDNAGPAAARNHGLRLSRGDWVAFTDDDCAPLPDWLVAFDACSRSQPTALLGGHCDNVLLANGWSEASELVAHAAEDASSFITSNNVAASRERLVEMGGFDESFDGPAGEDRVLATSFTAAGGLVVRCDDAVVQHAHTLDGLGFWRQHQRFGRAVVAVRRADRALGVDSAMSGSARLQMLRDAHDRGGAALLGRVLLSQAAVITGLARQRVGR